MISLPRECRFGACLPKISSVLYRFKVLRARIGLLQYRLLTSLDGDPHWFDVFFFCFSPNLACYRDSPDRITSVKIIFLLRVSGRLRPFILIPRVPLYGACLSTIPAVLYRLTVLRARVGPLRYRFPTVLAGDPQWFGVFFSCFSLNLVCYRDSPDRITGVKIISICESQVDFAHLF